MVAPRGNLRRDTLIVLNRSAVGEPEVIAVAPNLD